MLKLLLEALRAYRSSSANATGAGPLRTLKVLRLASSTLSEQAGLYAELVQLELEAQKVRYKRMMIFLVIAFFCLLGLLIFTGVFILALSWDTEYRIHSILLIMFIYLLGLIIFGLQAKKLATAGPPAFETLKQEICADINAIKSEL